MGELNGYVAKWIRDTRPCGPTTDEDISLTTNIWL